MFLLWTLVASTASAFALGHSKVLNYFGSKEMERSTVVEKEYNLKKLQDLQKRNKELLEENEKLTRELGKLNGENDEIRKENEDLRAKNKEQEQQIKKLEEENEKLKEANEQLEASNESYKSKIEELTVKNRNLEEANNKLKGKIDFLKEKSLNNCRITKALEWSLLWGWYEIHPRDMGSYRTVEKANKFPGEMDKHLIGSQCLTYSNAFVAGYHMNRLGKSGDYYYNPEPQVVAKLRVKYN